MFKKLQLISLSIFINFIFCNISIGQELPVLKEVQVKATAVFSNEFYSYEYSITNGAVNTGDLYSIDIDIIHPKGGIMLSSEGLTIPRGKVLHTFEEEMPQTEITITPVGMRASAGWIAGIGIDGLAGWGSRDKFEIKPGETLEGFKLISYGLPGIRSFKASPWLDDEADYYPGWESVEGADDVAAAIRTKVQELIEKVSFIGKTLGPTAPPADLKPLDFLNYIISLKHEAYNLGWIIQGEDDDKGKEGDEGKGIMKSLDKKLEKAREKLEKGDVKEAIEKLKSFIHEVEALYKEEIEYEHGEKDKKDKEKEAHHHEHITSEAYALLKYNTQYLVEKFGGEKKEKDEKGKKE